MMTFMSFEIKIYQQKPENFAAQVEVAASYVNLNGKLLLLQLSPNKSEVGAWGVPAGKLEPGENPVKGAKRELFEETGILADIASLKSLGVLYIRKPNIDYVYHLFSLNLYTFPVISLSAEHSAYKWVSRSEVEDIPLMEGARQALGIYYIRIES